MTRYLLKMIGLGVSILLIAIAMVISFQKGLYFTVFVLVLFFFCCLYLIWQINKQIIVNIEKILAGVAKKDYSQILHDTELTPDLLASIQTIQYNQQNNQGENSSQKHIFGQIIESMDTGILILKELEHKEKEVYFVNQAFAELLEIPKFTKWHLAQEQLQAFNPYIEQWKDRREVITLSINNKEQIFSLGTFLSKLYDSRYLIIHLDTLQSIIDRKEKEAWYNLMKVMSHEILNTITPIHSLSNNLEYLISERREELGSDFEDIHTSVVTISKRTQHLADFVDTYRQLSELPSPQKEQVKIKPLIESSLKVLSAMIEDRKIEVSIDINPVNSYFSIDSKQIEQAIINLVTNSIYALENNDQPYIKIRSYQTSSKQCIEITDNGSGIAQDIKRDVFVPFFTTRENGAGIGLSLAKNIVQAHGGLIGFTSDSNKTTFLLQFDY